MTFSKPYWDSSQLYRFSFCVNLRLCEKISGTNLRRSTELYREVEPEPADGGVDLADGVDTVRGRRGSCGGAQGQVGAVLAARSPAGQVDFRQIIKVLLPTCIGVIFIPFNHESW